MKKAETAKPTNPGVSLPRNMEIGGENWTFELEDNGNDFLRLQLFHMKLIELLTMYPWETRPPPSPEAFAEAWKTGIEEYRAFYEREMDITDRSNYWDNTEILDWLYGHFENQRFGFPLFQVGQNSEPKHDVRKGGPYRAMRKELLSKFGYRCQICHNKLLVKDGKVAFNAHHIAPLSLGGAHSIDNMVPLCKACHSSITSEPERAMATLSSETKRIIRRTNAPINASRE